MSQLITSPVCQIRHHQLFYQEKPLVTATNHQEFFSTAYQLLGLNYPKFFKMDGLCKTAFLAAEVVLKNFPLPETCLPEEIALLLSCRNSSTDTDLKYWESTKTNSSPGLFVYTLPNIMAGEICIRHGIKGENFCFIKNEYEASFHQQFSVMLLREGKAKCVLNGFADFLKGEYEAFFYLATLENVLAGI